MNKIVRRGDIQGLRAVAILLVVMFHAGLNVPGGFTGVDVFFAISGFVITGVLLADLESADAIDFPRFYARRVKRLLPALALMLAVVSLLGIVASPVVSQRIEAENGAWAALFSANVYLLRLGTGYFDVSASLNGLLHTWTLAVEEQFYVVFPVLLLIGWKLAARRRRTAGRATAAALVLAISLLSFIFYNTLGFASAPFGSDSVRVAFFSSPSRAWEFGLGAVLALVIPWFTQLKRSVAASLSILGGGAIVLGAAVIDGADGFPGLLALLPVGGACALLAAGTAHRVGVYPVLATRPMVWIGNLSYSWYLWHWPLIVYARALWPGSGSAAPAAAVASLLPAWVSYRFVENPIRFNAGLRGMRVVMLAVVCIAVGLSASLALYESPHLLSTATAIQEFGRARAFHADLTHGCDSTVPLGQRSGQQCVWTVPHPRGNVVLIGDSNAGHFTEPFVRAANHAGYSATVATSSACPFLPLDVHGSRQAGCRAFGRGSLVGLLAVKPALVIAAARTSWYLETERIALASDDTPSTRDQVDKARMWGASLAAYVRRLNGVGIPVVVVHEALMPPTAPNDPTGCAVIRVLLRRCERSFSRRAAERERALSLTTEMRAIAGAPRTWGVDFASDLCSRRSCPEARGPVLMYRDREHLSVAGALTLTSRFYRIVSARARG
jgi:peptidoglycan/LPS O-acetylase OafA/YrhL